MTRENFYPNPNDRPEEAAKKIFGDIKWTASPGNGKEKGKEKDKKINAVQKYSEAGLLAEAVIVGGVPHFAVSRLRSKSNPRDVDIVLESSIEIDDKREYKPFEASAYLNEPYRFSSKEDFQSCIKEARSETLDSLYKKVKRIWTKYIDADDFHLSICAADTIFTYYQDRMGLTHYLFFVGGNDSGKSNNLFVLKYLAYRNFTSTGMTVANIYQFLGNGEEGQGTLCYDEAEKLDEDRLMMAALKSGYLQGCPVARTDTSFGRTQLKFNTYCWKAFAAEKFPDPIIAKGFIQRCIELKCFAGDPEYDIVEVIDESGAEEFKELKKELNDMHNLLLAVRLLHFHEVIPDVKLNIKRREKQLFKPLIRIFQNAETLNELLPVISDYVTQRREVNSTTLHAFLYRVARDLIKSRQTSRIEPTFVWKYIKSNLQGSDISNKPLSYDSAEFDVISQKEILSIYDHVFGAKCKKRHGVRKINFDVSKLGRLGKIYELATEVRVVRDGDDSFETNRGTDWTDWTHSGLGKYASVNTDEREPVPGDGDSERENGLEDDSAQSISSINASNASNASPPIPIPSPNPISESEENKAAKLKEYDRLSALSRKKSKSASQINDGPLNENLSGDKHDPQAKPPSGGVG